MVPSSFECLAVIIAAFSAMEQKGTISFTPKNSEQTVLTQEYHRYKNRLNKFTPEELAGICDRDPKAINAFMQERGQSLTVHGPVDDRHLYLGAVAKAHMKWLRAGRSESFQYNNVSYEGVELEKGVSIYTYEDPTKNFGAKSVDVLEIATENEQQRVLMIPDLHNKRLARFGLLEALVRLKRANVNRKYDRAQFPEVKLKYDNDVKWLSDFSVTQGNRGYDVTDAKQQTLLEIDRFGAKAESAVAMELCERGMKLQSGEVFKIEGPFYAAIMDTRLQDAQGALPLFYGYCGPDSWETDIFGQAKETTISGVPLKEYERDYQNERRMVATDHSFKRPVQKGTIFSRCFKRLMPE